MQRTPYILKTLFTSLIIVAPLPAAAQNDLAVENFQQADANGDGALAFAEFATFIDLNAEDAIGNAKRISSRGLHSRAFARVDANSDGLVTTAELQAMQ